MPANRFPDSVEKRELRRIDGRNIQKFRTNAQLTGLSYCGMPSVEFLDVLAWRSEIRRVEAIEYDQETYNDMQIQWKNLSIPVEYKCVFGNVYEYLRSSTETFDLYNLDFYGGFLNQKKDGSANATEALRALIARHGARAHSFILIT